MFMFTYYKIEMYVRFRRRVCVFAKLFVVSQSRLMCLLIVFYQILSNSLFECDNVMDS